MIVVDASAAVKLLLDELGCDLVTCDAKFRDRAAASCPQVRLLADLN